MADADADKWMAPANETIQCILVRAGTKGIQEVESFHPAITHAIFGNDEEIFGFQDLAVNIRFASHDLSSHLDKTFTEAYKGRNTIGAANLDLTLEELLDPTANNHSLADFSDRIQKDKKAATWHPPGECIKCYQKNGTTYGIWRSDLSNTEVKRILGHAQIFILFFIDGGRHLDLDDPDTFSRRWTVYFLYRIDDPETAGEGSPYVFVGYNTSFRCWFQDGLQPQKPTLSNGEGDPSIDLSQIPNLKHACRHRIAQFLILPPFAGKGHGEMFYTAIFHDLTSDPTCRFLTVEDPNEQFDDLRDLCDLTRLRADPESFKDLALDTTLTIPKRGPLAHDLIPYDAISARAAQLKLARVQLVRLLELQLLDEVPEEEKVRTEAQKKVYRAWRVWVKMRVYRKNKELLAEFDIEERRERLDRTLEGLEENYRRVLAKLAARKGERGVKRKGSGEEGEDEGGGLREEGRRGKGKKLRLDDDSD